MSPRFGGQETRVIENLIRKLEQFSPLSAEERASLKELPVRLRNYSRGEMIVEQGSRPEESAVVMAGIAFRFKLVPDGARQIVGLQVPGDFVDLHSFVLNPIDHAVTAASPAVIGKIAHTALEKLLEKHPRLSRPLMWDMAVDAAIAREWLAIMGRRSAYQQLAHLFCELYFRMDWAGQVRDQGFDFALTQAELGDVCGLSTVHVNRSLQALRKDGLIALENHTLTIPNIDALVRAAEFDPAYLHLLKEA
jgi:CRP-like cAMP-binding protein